MQAGIKAGKNTDTNQQKCLGGSVQSILSDPKASGFCSSNSKYDCLYRCSGIKKSKFLCIYFPATHRSMSEDRFQNNVLKHVTHSAGSLKEKAYELQTTRLDEKENNPAQVDDALDDSSSSYCTALCSLSEYSEALEEETQSTCTEPPSENVSSGTSQSDAFSESALRNSSPENIDLLQDLKRKQNNSKETQDDLRKKTIHGKNMDSAKTPVSIESKQPSSNPKITVLNVNLRNINSVVANQDSNPSNKPNSTSLDHLNSKQYAAPTDTQPVQNVGTMEHKLTRNGILNTGKETFCQEISQEHKALKPEEHPITFQERLGNAHYKSGTFRPDSDKSIISKTKCKGEEHGERVGKEQAGQSLNTGNRKLPSGCTSTLNANKQKSGILPRCYSKRLLTTGNQHQSQNPLVSRRLKNQDGQNIKLSTLLPQTPCSSTRQHCNSADNTEGKFSMATKIVGTTTEVGCLTALEYTRASCPETNYLDVFNSSCWSSTQLSSKRYFYNWSNDVLSVKMPMLSTTNNKTSAGSEASSIECIDVALENHEEVDRNAKTVPKRQIQLKRRDNAENRDNEKDVIPSTPSWPRDTLRRQHSMPAAFHQDSHGSETKSGPHEQKQKLQKSLSLDETSSKTKMASCIIKNILSKRMQHEQNFHSVDIPDQTFCPIKTDGSVNNIDLLASCTKEACSETNERNLATVSLLSCHTDFQTHAQTMSSIKEHISVSSKVHPKLITKHSFNPLHGGLGKTQFQGSVTEIASYSETEKEKQSPSKEAKQGSRVRLSCDSAKGKAWNLSAVTSTVGKQAAVKTTPEECVNVQATQQQHYAKDQPIEKQKKPGEIKESTQSLTESTWLACSLDANVVDNILPQSALSIPKKDQEDSKGEHRPFGQSVNMGIQGQGKVKAIAPVHVVRDMRSLVKNTYSLSFRGPTEAVQGLDVPSFAAARPHPVISKRENKVKRHKQAEKVHVPKATLPLALDTVMDLSSLETTSSECATKVFSILESKSKIPHTGFTKVSPVSAAQTNSCGLSKSPEVQNSTTATNKTNAQCSKKYVKKPNCASKPNQAHRVQVKETVSNTSKKEQCTDSRNTEREKPMHPTQPLVSASQSSDKQASGLPAISQSVTGHPSACILTVAPAPVFPSYFYKTNVLGYQTISPNMGTVSYVQGPVLLQTPPHSQAATSSGSVPLNKSLSLEERLIPQPYTADGHPVPQESSKQMENAETSQKMPCPDTQPCTAFITTLGAEGIHGGASILYPEMSVSQHVSNPQHMLLDPETGQYFFVDMPQLPQRKMLFDPETCQYVEVVVPQQTLSGSVLTTQCALPFPSLHIPAMFTPNCLSYVQTHHQVLAPPEP